MTLNNKTYNHPIYEDFFEENKPEDIISSDVTIDSDVAARYIDITLQWDYNKIRMERVTDFSYSQMIKRLSVIVNSVRAFGITKPTPKISFTLKTDRWIDNPDYIEVNKPSELFPEIQQAVLNAPAPKGLLRPAVIIVLRFSSREVQTESFERFYKEMIPLVGYLNKILKQGSVFFPFESLAERCAGIKVVRQNLIDGIGGPNGLSVVGWNRVTMKKLFKLLTGNEIAEEPDDRKRGMPSEMDLPKIYRIMHDLKYDKSAQKDYIYHLVGYETANTYEKVFYIYLIPRDPDSKYGEYQEYFQWFKENVQSRLNKYDEQEILNTANAVTVTIKVSSNGFRPRRTDGKKELKIIETQPYGIEYKMLFYDGDWDKFGSFKHNKMFSNGMLKDITANREYFDDVEKGFYGKEAQENAKEETAISNPEISGK